MKLSGLIQGLLPPPPLAFDPEIRTVTENPKKADSNSVFVCIRGANTDGHRYADSAYANGCRVFVGQADLTLAPDALYFRVENPRHMLALLACRLADMPSQKLHVIGITGTKGKTTTAHLLAHILNQCGTPCAYIGTNGISYSNIRIATKNTTPDAVTLQQTLADIERAGIRTVVMEVSSQAILQNRVDGTHFRTLIFTNLSPDHIGQNEHPDFENYKACKHRLFTDFDAESVIFNADDPASDDMLCDCPAKVRISCSDTDQHADFRIGAVTLLRDNHMWGVRCNVFAKSTSSPCKLELPLIGHFNATNALLALACASRTFGISLADACAALRSVTVAGRSELIPLPNGACAVIDYAHNRASMESLLLSLRQYATHRLIALFGSVGERSQMRRHELGEVAASLCDLCILTSDNPGTEPPEAIIDEIAEAFVGSSVPYLKIIDRAEAIRTALSLMRSGDILVLVGKGHETYQLIGKEQIAFCERAILLDAIKILQ